MAKEISDEQGDGIDVNDNRSHLQAARVESGSRLQTAGNRLAVVRPRFIMNRTQCAP